MLWNTRTILNIKIILGKLTILQPELGFHILTNVFTIHEIPTTLLNKLGHHCLFLSPPGSMRFLRANFGHQSPIIYSITGGSERKEVIQDSFHYRQHKPSISNQLKKWVFIESTLKEAYSSGHAKQPGLSEAKIGNQGRISGSQLSSGSWPSLSGWFLFLFLFACCFCSPKCPILIALQLEKIGDYPLRKSQGRILIGLTPALGLP